MPKIKLTEKEIALDDNKSYYAYFFFTNGDRIPHQGGLIEKEKSYLAKNRFTVPVVCKIEEIRIVSRNPLLVWETIHVLVEINLEP